MPARLLGDLATTEREHRSVTALIVAVARFVGGAILVDAALHALALEAKRVATLTVIVDHALLAHPRVGIAAWSPSARTVAIVRARSHPTIQVRRTRLSRPAIRILDALLAITVDAVGIARTTIGPRQTLATPAFAVAQRLVGRAVVITLTLDTHASDRRTDLVVLAL